LPSANPLREFALRQSRYDSVEYVYILNDWFKDPGYKDVLDYIDSVNCHYRFGSLPLAWLGLPDQERVTIG
jgi:hypothetical protein